MPWKRHLFTLGAAAVGAGVIAFYWNVAVRPPAEERRAETPTDVAPMEQPLVTVVDPAKGPKDAAVTIVEFGDHACPHCRSTQEAADRLLAAYPGRVRFVWKSAPSPLHPGSDVAAEAALCAARGGKFWEYHARLFENSGLFDQASMAILANELGLDPTEFSACLTQDQTLPLVERTVTEARALGLTSVPTLFINGKRHEGAMTYEQLLEASGL